MAIIIFIILFVGIIACVLLTSLYRKSIAYKNANVAILKYQIDIPESLQLANFGSTYSMYAFNSYNELRLNAFNFAIDAQSLEIDEKLLSKYASQIAPGATVIFGLAACVTYYRYSMVSNKTRYYEFLDKKDIPNYSLSCAIRHHFPLSLGRMKAMVGAIVRHHDVKDIYAGYPSVLSREVMELNMQRMANGWIKMFHLSDLKQRNTNMDNEQNKDFNTSLLRSMFEFCLSKGWKPVVVITPFSDILNKYFGDEFIATSLGDMISKATDGLKVDVLDYRLHPAFQQDYSSYLDGGFRLNKKGSIKFVKQVLNDLNIKGYSLTNSTIGC